MLITSTLFLFLRLIELHLNIENRLLHSFLLLAGDFEVKSPVEIVHFSRACKLVLHIGLSQWCARSHLLE